MLWLEVMEGGKKDERKEEFGVTASCMIRGVEHLEEFEFVDCTYLPSLQPRLFLGDSWFGSVNATYQISKLGHHGCFVINTAYSRAPKTFLKEKMQHFPSGTWIVIEGCAGNEGILLICIGYKCNLKKALVFIPTKGAGSMQPGQPYVKVRCNSYAN